MTMMTMMTMMTKREGTNYTGANLASPAMKQRQTILTSWLLVVFVTIIIIIFCSIIIITIMMEIALVTFFKNHGEICSKVKEKVTRMTSYATHQLVKSETNGGWSHLAPNLLTAAPKIAIKLSPKTAGVPLP